LEGLQVAIVDGSLVDGDGEAVILLFLLLGDVVGRELRLLTLAGIY
jgi:hypothetical protein